MMKFCRECGNKLTEHAIFCRECGTKAGEVKSRQEIKQLQIPHQQPLPKKPISKKAKILWISVVTAIIILFGTHKLIESMMSKDRLIEKFETALAGKNAKDVARLLTSSDKSLKVEEASIAGLMEYFNENPDQIKNIVSELKSQSKKIDSAKKEKLMDFFGGSDGKIIVLEQDGKFLFYDKYKLIMESVYLSVETNHGNAIIFVDGVEVGKTGVEGNRVTFGPFLPGYHQVTASLKTDFIDLKSKEEKVFVGGYSDKANVYIHLDAGSVTVDVPEYENVLSSPRLFINGKKVDIDLYEHSTFGPILVDGSMNMYVEYDFPWGTVRTEEQAIDKDYMSFEFMNESLQTTLMETVHKYHGEWTEAYTSVDSNGMTTASQEVKEQILSEAVAAKENERAAKIQFLGSNFDMNSFNLSNESGKWIASLDAQYMSKEIYYYVGENVTDLRDSVNHNTFKLQYDENEGRWLIYEIGYPWFFNSDNLKELMVENPRTYESAWIGEVVDVEEEDASGTEEG